MKSFKDTATTICGFIFAISTSLLVVPSIPSWATTALGLAMALSGAIIGVLTGKNPNGSTKVIDPATGQQDVNQNITKEQEPAK